MTALPSAIGRQDLADFLPRNGDPYERIGSDPRSRVQIALGSSGVPESFVVDGKGVIRYQHIGPIDAIRTCRCILRSWSAELCDRKRAQHKHLWVPAFAGSMMLGSLAPADSNLPPPTGPTASFPTRARKRRRRR